MLFVIIIETIKTIIENIPNRNKSSKDKLNKFLINNPIKLIRIVVNKIGLIIFNLNV